MKIAYCLNCGDFVTPLRAWRTTREWRWCYCRDIGTRWRDGDRGLLEVASKSGADWLRVIGMNNTFINFAIEQPPLKEGVSPEPYGSEQWRAVHDLTCTAADGYLFSTRQRDCWALIVRPGESGDVFVIDYAEASQ